MAGYKYPFCLILRLRLLFPLGECVMEKVCSVRPIVSPPRRSPGRAIVLPPASASALALTSALALASASALALALAST